MGIVALVLLLACVNLSGLLLARAASRSREIRYDSAIGAGADGCRQFLRRVCCWWFSAPRSVWRCSFSAMLFRLFVGDATSRRCLVGLFDRHVLAFTITVSLIACLIVGFAPAWRPCTSRSTRP